MSSHSFRIASMPALLALCLTFAGCASDRSRSAEERPEALTRATATVDAAEKAGAYEHANVELTMARRKLTDADKALTDGDREIAARLAEEADLDAQLAMAKSRNEEMQAAVAELRESIRTLQEGLRRDETQTLGRL